MPSASPSLQRSFRVIGGPIPKEAQIRVSCSDHDLIAVVLERADLMLQRHLEGKPGGRRPTEVGVPLIHASQFDALVLQVVGGGQAKVVAVLSPDDRVGEVCAAYHPHVNGDCMLLLRARSAVPPGLPNGPQEKVLKLLAPLVVKKKPPEREAPPPPPKPDLALRVIGGPIPKDVRIVIHVHHDTCFMDMFPLIHEKVELVVPLSVVSSRYFTLHEFELVRHGKGKKRRALFAKDTPESVSLVSRVLMLVEKPLWQHIQRPLSGGGGGRLVGDGDDASSASSDHLSDIRPASATSTLRDRDADTPPGTVAGDGNDGFDDGHDGGAAQADADAASMWWQAASDGTAGKSRVLTMQALKLKDAGLDAVAGAGAAAGQRILELVAPENQQAQLIRVIGKPIPKTARVIIDIVRTQTFASFFPLIQSKVVHFLPTANITPYRYECVELRIERSGALKPVRSLPLDATPWSIDFGLASVVYLREIPDGYLRGTEEQPLSLQYPTATGRGTAERDTTTSGSFATMLGGGHDPQSTSVGNRGKPSTATSLQSLSTVVAPRRRLHSDHDDVDESQDEVRSQNLLVETGSRRRDALEASLGTLPSMAANTSDAASHAALETGETNHPSTFDFDVDQLDFHEETPHDGQGTHCMQDEAERATGSGAAFDRSAEVIDDTPVGSETFTASHGEPTTPPPNPTNATTSDLPKSTMSPTRASFSSPIREDKRQIVADVSSDSEDEHGDEGTSRPSSQSIGLRPARVSSRYLLYQPADVSAGSGVASSRPSPAEENVARVTASLVRSMPSEPPPPPTHTVVTSAVLPHAVAASHDDLDTLELEYDVGSDEAQVEHTTVPYPSDAAAGESGNEYPAPSGNHNPLLVRGSA